MSYATLPIDLNKIISKYLVFTDMFDHNSKVKDIKYIWNNFHFVTNIYTIREKFGTMCLNGNLDILKFLYNTFDLSMTFNERKLERKNEVKASVYVLNEVIEFTLTDMIINGFYYSCRNGHLEIAKWLTLNYHLNIDDVKYNNYDVIRSVCKNGRLNVLEWLIDHFGLDSTMLENNPKIIREMNMYKKTDIKEWLFKKLNYTVPRLLLF